MKFLIKLYPAWWRKRYGKELEVLLEDSGSRAALDLFRGAMEMQMKTWSFRKVVAVCGIAGVLIAGAVAFSMPYRYQSTATLKLSQPDAEAMVRMSEAAFTRNALRNTINNFNLYPRERKRMSMEDVIDNVMRKQIQVRPVRSDLAQVSFAYEDPVQAQRVNQDLVGRMIAANLEIGQRINQNGQRIELLVAADQAKKQIEGKARTAFTALGLPAGLLFGVVLALILRRRAPIR